jgi:subtilase family serine protease
MHRSSSGVSFRGLAPVIAISLAGMFFAAAPAIAAPVRGAGSAGSRPESWSRVFARPAAPAGSRPVGRLPASAVLRGAVALRPRDPAALAAYSAAVTTPRSPLYQHYLGAGQFAAWFGPGAGTITAVESHLRADGVRVTGVSGNGLLVSFTATAADAEAAFGTRLERYRLADGAVGFAPAKAVGLPANIAPAVQTVLGLNTTARPIAEPLRGKRGAGSEPTVKPTATADGPKACSAARADAAAYGGLTDQQIASSYGVDRLYNAGEDGAGQTVAVYELEPFSRSDIRVFDSCYFGASKASAMLKRLSVVSVDGGQQAGYGSGESELDIDDVSAVAPGANIEVYEAPNTFYGLVDEFNTIVQNDNAKVATSSWASGCEAAVQAEVPGLESLENTIFEQAAIQGQTVLEWAGDDGSDGCAIHGSSPVAPILSQNVEGDQPYVLSVGGTAITDPTDPPTEEVWNDGSDWGAAGGGISQVWAAPSWQTSSHVPGFDNASIVKRAEKVAGTDFCEAAVCREVPDVTAQADQFTGAITVYETPYGGWVTFGGTSSSTPLWASMLTDIASTPACEAAGGLGFVPPKLYAIGASSKEYAASFNDITKGNNDVFDDAGGLFPTTAGYDLASGLGSPRVTAPGGGKGLAYYLCDAASGTVPTVTKVAPEAVPQAGGTVTITGSGFTAKGVSDVGAVQVGSINLPKADFTVNSASTITAHLPSSAGEAGTGDVVSGTGTYAVTVTLTDGQSSKLGPATRVTYFTTTQSSPNAQPTVVGVDSPGDNEAGGQVVTVYGSGFSAGTGTPSVTFGGVAGTGVHVVNDSELTVTVPAYSAGTTKCVTNLNPVTNICQTQAQVTTSNGASAESTILPEYSGPVVGGTGEELPAATEFDYFPTPKITSISVAGGLASEQGDSVATITGAGLGELGLDWANVGPYQDLTSEDFGFEYYSGTEIQLELPAEYATTSDLSVPVTIQTEGSLNNGDLLAKPPSNSKSVTYAPTPVVTSIEVIRKGSVSKYDAGPGTGGPELVIKGKGLGATSSVQFTDVGTAFGKTYGISTKTAFTLNKVTATEVTLTTPGDQPGVDQISACDVSGCSAPLASGDTFTYYPIGAPKVTSVSRAKGKAGTKVTIDGTNLGFTEAVYFGKVKAKTFANVPTLLDCGSTYQITAIVPAGKAGSKVEIRVVTLESEVTGSGKSPANPKVTFTYQG